MTEVAKPAIGSSGLGCRLLLADEVGQPSPRGLFGDEEEERRDQEKGKGEQRLALGQAGRYVLTRALTGSVGDSMLAQVSAQHVS
jgi:hypothetical protein